MHLSVLVSSLSSTARYILLRSPLLSVRVMIILDSLTIADWDTDWFIDLFNHCCSYRIGKPARKSCNLIVLLIWLGVCRGCCIRTALPVSRADRIFLVSNSRLCDSTLFSLSFDAQLFFTEVLVQAFALQVTSGAKDNDTARWVVFGFFLVASSSRW